MAEPRKLLLGLAAVAAAGAGLVLATNEELRSQVARSAKALGEEIAGGDPDDGDA